MLDLNDITLRIAGRVLLEGASLHMPANRRFGLVGRNGTGKTSLFRLLTGEWHVDAGEVRLQPGIRVGIVAQEAPGGSTTPMQAVLAADKERHALMQERATATDGLRIAEVENRLLEIQADAAPARAAIILKGLGFDEEMQARPLSAFSGGWRMRVALAGVLFAEPDLLLLDEPTNHLDLEATLWLTEHLAKYPRSLLLISHDRDLLDAVPERIVHLENQKLTTWTGGFTQFRRQFAEQRELREKMRAKQLERRAHLQSFVDRFRAKATKARQAQSRLKMLEKMPVLDAEAMEPDVVFDFPQPEPPPPPLITMDRAAVGYDSKIILSGLSLRIDPDDRIALIGANGNGKSTFAKLLADRLQPMSGELTRARGLKVGFFAQHQIEDLTPDADAIAHLRRLLPDTPEQKLRSRLARFGLNQDKAITPAKNLSGGEKARLNLAMITCHDPQFLILDEPTNHLDIDSREALIEAINEFPGAVVLVSHDRHLLELTADRLWLVGNGRVTPFDGDIDDYRQQMLSERANNQKTPTPTQQPAPPKRTQNERRQKLAPLRQEAAKLERLIERIQAAIAEIDAKMADPKSYMKGLDLEGLGKKKAEYLDGLAKAEGKWLEMLEEIEGIEIN
ncbi:ABC-F family ATP-binding cassette domain-containing protein [Geminicoccus roseus]|uniref:ABC-F family ATP-binding cassette domain-containing protein n=1 Tax=Geminicoccus roseus TaxID=404900 RepID=UPI00040E3236|nr:ABC-F family ATP-binding cassette domain-containing protein [Geminicoccus roseus]